MGCGVVSLQKREYGTAKLHHWQIVFGQQTLLDAESISRLPMQIIIQVKSTSYCGYNREQSYNSSKTRNRLSSADFVVDLVLCDTFILEVLCEGLVIALCVISCNSSFSAGILATKS